MANNIYLPLSLYRGDGGKFLVTLTGNKGILSTGERTGPDNVWSITLERVEDVRNIPSTGMTRIESPDAYYPGRFLKPTVDRVGLWNELGSSAWTTREQWRRVPKLDDFVAGECSAQDFLAHWTRVENPQTDTSMELQTANNKVKALQELLRHEQEQRSLAEKEAYEYQTELEKVEQEMESAVVTANVLRKQLNSRQSNTSNASSVAQIALQQELDEATRYISSLEQEVSELEMAYDALEAESRDENDRKMLDPYEYFDKAQNALTHRIVWQLPTLKREEVDLSPVRRAQPGKLRTFMGKLAFWKRRKQELTRIPTNHSFLA